MEVYLIIIAYVFFFGVGLFIGRLITRQEDKIYTSFNVRNWLEDIYEEVLKDRPKRLKEVKGIIDQVKWSQPPEPR